MTALPVRGRPTVLPTPRCGPRGARCSPLPRRGRRAASSSLSRRDSVRFGSSLATGRPSSSMASSTMRSSLTSASPGAAGGLERSFRRGAQRNGNAPRFQRSGSTCRDRRCTARRPQPSWDPSGRNPGRDPTTTRSLREATIRPRSGASAKSLLSAKARSCGRPRDHDLRDVDLDAVRDNPVDLDVARDDVVHGHIGLNDMIDSHLAHGELGQRHVDRADNQSRAHSACEHRTPQRSVNHRPPARGHETVEARSVVDFVRHSLPPGVVSPSLPSGSMILPVATSRPARRSCARAL